MLKEYLLKKTNKQKKTFLNDIKCKIFIIINSDFEFKIYVYLLFELGGPIKLF